LSDGLAAPADDAERRRVDTTLAQSLVGLPLLRGIALVDRDGRICASSNPSEVGLRIDLARLGALPEAGADVIGDPVAGRGLAALAIDSPQAPIPAGLGFIALLHRVDGAGTPGLLLMGQVNPDVFATYQQSALDGEDPRSLAMLVSFRGRLMAATRGVPLAFGATLAQHVVLQARLADQEHATFAAPGLGGTRSIVTFRASRALPLLVIVERPYDAMVAQWWTTIRWVALFTLVGLVFIGVMTRVAWRSLRSRERSRHLLDDAQMRIAHRERELSVLVTRVQEIIFRTDALGRIGFVNARWHAIDPLGPEAARGRMLHEIVLPADAGKVLALFDPTDARGARTARVALGEDATGPRIFDIAVVSLRAAGAVIGFAGSAIDITDRQRAEQKLREQLSFSALLLEVSPLPVSPEDTQGRLIAVNHAWEAFVGTSREQALGQPACNYFPPSRRLVKGEHNRYEIQVRHGDSSMRDMVVTQVGVEGEHDDVVGTLSVAIDVSEYREAERATREARDAAEETSRAKSQFIANISHEMRTPLQSIMGFSELGMMRPGTHASVLAMFEDIHAAGQRMLSVVNDLLDVSKIESTVGTFHLERVDLRAVARAVARELQPLLGGRQLSLQVSMADEPLLCKVDPTRVQQVLRNMLANAIKFSPGGSTIELQGEVDPDGFVHFCVRDHGPGIPPAELEDIFEAFVQSSRTKDGSGGTGLGLAICRKIVDAHGGRIAARNAPDGGAAFDGWLPYNNSAETRPASLDELAMGS
jgi:PAS domain S-box-containing protein